MPKNLVGPGVMVTFVLFISLFADRCAMDFVYPLPFLPMIEEELLIHCTIFRIFLKSQVTDSLSENLTHLLRLVVPPASGRAFSKMKPNMNFVNTGRKIRA